MSLVTNVRWRRAVPAACLAIVLASAPARGSAGPACSMYGTAGLIWVRSAAVQTAGVLALSLGGHYYESADLAGELAGGEPGRFTSLHLDASYGVTPWLGVGLDLPFRRVEWVGGDGGARGAVLGSPSAAVRFGVPASRSWLSVAVEGRAEIPLDGELTVAGEDGSETYFLTGGTADWEVVLLATADLTPRFPLKIHGNAGWAFNLEDERGRRFFPHYYPAVSEGGAATDNDALILRCAVEFPGRSIDLFTEFRGDVIRDRALVAPKENALSVTPGIRARLGGGWIATVGFTVGLSGNDRSTPDFDPHETYPDWEVAASLAFAWPLFAADTDGDGVPDYSDRCPMTAEDFDGFEDSDGCPDADNDGDGIPDLLDGAPNLAEDIDGFEDGDGVPDLDNDGDGIIDRRDMCPDSREDLDGFEDEDGCPDE